MAEPIQIQISSFELIQKLFACTTSSSEKKQIQLKKTLQCAKKALSNSLGLQHFAIRLVNFVLSLPNGPVKSFENSNYRRTV